MSLLISLGLQRDDSHMNNMNIYKGVDLDKYKNRSYMEYVGYIEYVLIS